MKKVKDINWVETNSGIIESYCLYVGKKILYIMFKRTYDVWAYEVDDETGKEFLKAESKGKYFLANIKPKAKATKIKE